MRTSRTSVKKIWEIEAIEGYNFVAADVLITDDADSSFYAVCYPHHLPEPYLKLNKFSINNPEYETLGDSIPVKFKEQSGQTFFFYDKLSEEFIVAIRDSLASQFPTIKVYTLKYPPSNLYLEKTQNLNEVHNSGFIKNIFVVSFFVLLVLIIIVLVFVLLKKRLQAGKKLPAPEVKEHIEPVTHETNEFAGFTFKEPCNNMVQLLGGFKVYDNNGRDITYRFPPKLRRVFVLIMVKSLWNENLNSDNLTKILWPNKDKQHAKNIRGVNINNLRKIVDDIDGLELKYENKLWKFEFDDGFYCDYSEVSRHIDDMPDKESEFKFRNIVRKGNLLPNIGEVWLDKYKSKTEEKIINALLDLAKRKYNEEKYTDVLNIHEIMYNFDPINEVYYRLKINTLTKLKKYNELKKETERFKSEYFRIMNEEYVPE